MRVTLGTFIFLASAAHGFLGQWHSFTNKDHVACMQPFGGRMFVGTSGGIRSIDPATLEEKQYSNLDGLLEADIVSLAVTPGNRLWAASRGGFLYEWDGARWQAYGRSYVSERWRPNLRATLSAGKYIALGTEKGLTFFDTEKKVAQVNLTKIAGESNESVISLLRKGDTLFIGLEKGAYKAAVDWDNILSNRYASIFDPNIWTPVAFPPQVIPENPDPDSLAPPLDTLPRRYDQLFFRGDTLESLPRGTVQAEPFAVEALFGKPLKLAGKAYPDYPGFEVVAQMAGKIFLGGPLVLAAIVNPSGSTPETRPGCAHCRS